MKVSPISFSGLMGGGKFIRGRNEYGDYTHITLAYYPFQDESKQQIDEFVSEYSHNIKNEPTTYRDDTNMEHIAGKGDISVRVVDVKERLPFTSEEYDLYQKEPDKLSMKKRLHIKSIIEEIKRERKIKNVKMELS